MELKLLIWLSSKAPAAAINPGTRHQAWHRSSVGPCRGPRDLTVLTLLTICFSMSSMILLLNFIQAGIPLAVHSALQKIGWLGVPVGCMSKWVQLPPTSPPSSRPKNFLLFLPIDIN